MPHVDNFFLGIDPGKTGAAAAISKISIYLHDWHSPEKALNWLRSILEVGQIILAVIEDNDQRCMPHKGRIAAYDLALTCGIWSGYCKVYDIPLRMVKAVDWQRSMIGPDIIAASPKKRSILAARSRDVCLANVISKVKHHNRADALNMAFYAEMIATHEARLKPCEK